MLTNKPPRRENAKYKLVLYKTAGCEACRIAQNIVSKVVKLDYPHIHFYLYDYGYNNDAKLTDTLKQLKIKDFPTLILYRITLSEDIEEWRLEGTYPAEVIKDKINNTLNN